ncbi:MAG: WhiB family transcriptional regulator [Ilumatobacteraceae bacterium]|nr:WhiB family transcriptional regulator [Ilumatobacteraceae bacterium]
MAIEGSAATREIELIAVILPKAWTSDALCQGKTRLFFAPRAERPQARTRRESRAQQLCSKCPVAQECRESARQNHEYGYWGGENEEDRHLAGFTVAAPIGIKTRLPRTA